MRQRAFTTFVCSVVLSSLVAVADTAADGRASREYVPGQIIVQHNPAKNDQSLAADFTAISLHPIKPLSRRLNIWLYEYDTTVAKAADQHARVLDRVRQHPAVERAQSNHFVSQRAVYPDDPWFTNQWALHNTGQTGGILDADIDAPEAWEMTTSGVTAAGDTIVIAVVDAGCDLTHPDIAYFKNTLEIPANGLDDDGNGYVDDYDGWNAAQSSGSVVSSDHGTHVAGIAGALGHNGQGISGVNWSVRILPIVGSTIYESVAVEAYGYALEMRARYNESNGLAGAFVVATNSSFGVDYGDPADFPIWCAMYDSLGAYGVLSAGAGPNLDIDVDIEGDIPTACPSEYLIAVTNTTSGDLRNSSSGYGALNMDLGAPGTSVFSTLQGGGYGYKTGASMASPHVAGAVAFAYGVADLDFIVLARQHPDSAARLIRQAILGGVDSLPALAGITATDGRLNLYGAAQQVLAIPTGLTIAHSPLPDTRDTLNPYTITALITSDTSLIQDSLRLRYIVAGDTATIPFQSHPDPDRYQADIPAQPPGTMVEYAITAADHAGRAETAGPFSFRVIDYACRIGPESTLQSGLVGDTLWAPLTIINTGLLADRYVISTAGASWPTAILDSSGVLLIDTTAAVDPDDSLLCWARVIVPASIYLSRDTISVLVTSTARADVTAGASCVSASEGVAVPLPFVEIFPEPFFDEINWVIRDGGVIDNLALSAPSPPASLHLNGDPGGADTMVSGAVPLDSQMAVFFSYTYQRTGSGDSPEPGDDLAIDYVDSTGSWRELAVWPGDGPDMTSFAFVEHFLPGDALHRFFRFRLTSSGSPGPYDDWFVDDLRLEAAPASGVVLTPDQSTAAAPAGGLALHHFTLRNRGATADRFVLGLADMAGWPVTFYDSAGVLPLDTSAVIQAGDSTTISAVVSVPPGAAAGGSAVCRVWASSERDPLASDTVSLLTLSEGPAGTIPWSDDFPAETLDPSLWSEIGGASVVTAISTPPSPPYVLRLDGGTDTVVTQALNLNADSLTLISYWCQKSPSEPPDIGDSLWIEYTDTAGNWAVLDQIPGDGYPSSRFEARGRLLPADALQAGFRLRLRSSGSCSDCDIWYIDDVTIDYPPYLSVDPSGFSASLVQGDSALFTLIIGNGGPGELGYAINHQVPAATPASFSTAIDAAREPGIRPYPESFAGLPPAKGVFEIRTGVPVTRDAGGPDSYGYSWIDSDSPEGPAFNWTDISESGTDITVSLDDDNFSGPYPIGFPFPWYDTVRSEFYVGSNGLIGFASGGMDARTNSPIPDPSEPNSWIAWLWYDLNPDDAANPGAQVDYLTDSTRCIIQFTGYPEYGASPGDVITAQLILDINSSILLQYLQLSDGMQSAASLVGIEAPDGADGLEIAYLTPYVKDSLAVRIENPFAWLRLSNRLGIVPPGAADTVVAMVSSAGLDSGSYSIDLRIVSNDPQFNPVVLPVRLDVAASPAFICGDINGDGAGPTVADLTYLVAFLFRGGAPPPQIEAADVDSSGGNPNVADLTYLVDFLFRGGPVPRCSGL